jgi:hypothetical protein
MVKGQGLAAAFAILLRRQQGEGSRENLNAPALVLDQSRTRRGQVDPRTRMRNFDVTAKRGAKNQ